MQRQQQVRRTVIAMMAGDAVFLFVVIFVGQFLDPRVLAAICVPTLLISNVLFLRRKLRAVGPVFPSDTPAPRAARFPAYACSAIFFLGTLLGVLLISQGALPWPVLPVLIVPFSLAVFFLRGARKAGSRTSS